MLRTLSLGILLLVALSEANRCRYRELKAPYSEIRRPRGCRGAGSFIGEDYWTTVGYDGLIRDGRSKADFVTFDQSPASQGYIAYWITRTKYGDVHYEAFGHAFERPDRRICAWFVGLNKEIVEVCGGFRILSRNRYNPREENPFEWVRGTHLTSKNTLGFHEHRIAKYAWHTDEVFYGDARLQNWNFQGVSPSSERFMEVTSPSEFSEKVWLLRRKMDYPASSGAQGESRSDYRNYRYEVAPQDPRYAHLNDNRQYVNNAVQADRRQEEVRRVDPRLQDPRYRSRLHQKAPEEARNTEDTTDLRRDETTARRAENPVPIGSGVAPNVVEGAAAANDVQGVRIGEGVRPNSGSPRIGTGVQPNSDNGVRYARIRPPTLVRDQYGNTYERRIENGYTIFYADPHVQGRRIDTAVQQKVAMGVDERYQNEGWMRHRENMRRIAEERRREREQEEARNAWLLQSANRDVNFESPREIIIPADSQHETEWTAEEPADEQSKTNSEIEQAVRESDRFETENVAVEEPAIGSEPVPAETNDDAQDEWRSV